MTMGFYVLVSGGMLELRFCMLYRGGGKLINTIPVLRGGSVYVELGTYLTTRPTTAPEKYLDRY